MAKIDAFFNLMFEQKASDLHMASGNPPMMRIHGELQRVDYPPLENDSLKAMLARHQGNGAEPQDTTELLVTIRALSSGQAAASGNGKTSNMPIPMTPISTCSRYMA